MMKQTNKQTKHLNAEKSLCAGKPSFHFFAQWLQGNRERAAVLSEVAFFLQDAGELKGASCVYYAIVGILSAQSRNILGLMYQWTLSPEPPLHCYSQMNSSDYLFQVQHNCSATDQTSTVRNFEKVCIGKRTILVVDFKN